MIALILSSLLLVGCDGDSESSTTTVPEVTIPISNTLVNLTANNSSDVFIYKKSF